MTYQRWFRLENRLHRFAGSRCFHRVRDGSYGAMGRLEAWANRHGVARALR